MTTTCFAAGSNGQILASVNSGSTWGQQSSGIASAINGLSCPSTTFCVAAGDFGLLLRTLNGGASWSAQTTNSGNFFAAVSCPTTSTCYAVGFAGSLYKTVDGGTTWIAQVSNTASNLFGVSCSSAIFCAAVGQGGTVTDTADGVSWTVALSATTQTLEAVSCSGGHCAAVGLGGTTIEVFQANPSLSFTKVSGTNLNLFGVSCADAWTCYADGGLGMGLFFVWLPGESSGNWAWDGPGPRSDFFAASCPSTTACVAVGAGGAIASTTTRGSAWSAQSGGEGFGVWSAVSCPGSLSLCYAAGPNGSVGTSTDQGATWIATRTPAQGNLKGISCVSASVCEAVSEQGEVIGTTTAGASWTMQSTQTGKQLYSVSCPTAMTCFAVGWPGLIIATSNGGASWTTQASSTANPPTGPYLVGISCASSTACEVAVESGAQGGIYGTTDGGTTWAIQLSVPDHVSSVSCPSTLICYAAGNAGKMLKTTDGGTSWSSLSFASTWYATGVSCSSTTVCAAVGPFGGLGLSTTDGTNWTVATIGGAAAINCPTADCVTTGGADFISGVWTPMSGGLTAVSCPTTLACMAVGTGGLVLTTADGGSTWTTRSAGTFANLRSVSCPSAMTCYAVGDSGVLQATVDGGASWTTRSLPPSTVTMTAVSCGSTTACVAVGAALGSGGIVAYTVNGGSSWAAASTSPSGNLRGVSCPTASVCFAVGDLGVYSSTDGGASWPGYLKSPYSLAAISCVSAGTCIAVGDFGTILATGDGGATWTIRVSGTPENFVGVSCPTTSLCVASATGRLVLGSTDGGVSWSRRFAPVLWGISCATATNCHGVGGVRGVWATSTGGFGGWTTQRPSGNTDSLQAISCPSISTCYAVGFPGTFLVSNDGSSWVDHSINLDVELFALSCPTVTTCYAAGWPGVIYLTTNSGASWSPQANPVLGANVVLLGISCAGPTSCVAVGTGGTIISTSNGTTWATEISGTTQELTSISCPSSYSCVAAGIQGLTMTRSGGSWLAYASGTTQNLWGVNCPSASICYAVGNAGTVLFTSNRGASWTAQASGEVQSLYGISCPQTTLCLATGSSGTAVVTKDGSSWIDRSFATSNPLYSVAFPDAAHAWAAGYGGTILFNPTVVNICAGASVSVDHSPPQLVGTPITFTASSTGCSAPVYEFWLLAPGSSTWTVAQAYSSSATFNWTTTSEAAGTYRYSVWVRNASSTSSYDTFVPGTAYTLTSSACTSVTASAAPPSPSLPGTAVTFTAMASGCPNPRYQFWTLAPGGSWTIAQPYSTGAAFNWNTTGLPAGIYHFSVWVRDASSAGSYDAYFPGTAYTLTSTACTSMTASAAPPSTQTSGTAVTFTASASGCPNPRYQFWILAPGGSWTVAQPYSSNAMFNWTTTGLPAGAYHYSVWVRDASSAGSYDTYFPGTAYMLTSTPCKSVTASAAPTSPQTAGTAITITAIASGCPNPRYQFWILAPGGSWTIVQAYSGVAAFNWTTTGLPAGTYHYSVWVRNASSAAGYDAYFPGTTYTLT